jgi:hypothetical protein
VIRLIAIWVSILGLSLGYLLIQFRGLSSQTGIDQAQVARELARGNGFSTKNIRPLAIQQLQRNTEQLPAGNFPDTFNAPLNPLINSLVFRCFPGLLTKGITSTSSVFAGDRLVAGVSVLFFIASVAVNYFMARRLFDRRIAWISAAVGVFSACYFRGWIPRFLVPVIICVVGWFDSE